MSKVVDSYAMARNGSTDLQPELVDCLATTLNDKGITYCHWKSNFSLAQALSGETDLDLLVDRKFLGDTLSILTALGFRSALVAGEPVTPGILHYYGSDQQTGQLIHVHLFSRVLTGESFVKSHLLPFEPMLLENTELIGQIRVVSKSAELIIFIVRNFIKYGSLLDLVYLSREPYVIEAELDWLRAGSDLAETLDLLQEYCPMIDEALFLTCIDALKTPSSLIDRIMLARQVRRRLREYRRFSTSKRVRAYVRLLWGYGWRRLSGSKKGKIVQTGGTVVAFVGPEATGKSTLVAECEKWLSRGFVVRTAHAGKPPSTWLTAPINFVVPMARRLMPQMRTSRLEGHGATPKSVSQAQQPKIEGLSSMIYALSAVALAWDRRQLLIKVRRLAANGEIVICDRYPSETVGAMDSPRLRENSSKNGMIPAIYNRLARLERRLYQQIPPPDIVLRLTVSIEIAIKRNRERIKVGKESEAYVASRHRQNQTWHRFGTRYIYDIDTDQSLARTIASVKNAIWESL